MSQMPLMQKGNIAILNYKGETMVRELFKNVLPNFKTSIVYKNAKEGTKSFRITQQLIQSIWLKAKKLKNMAVVIITIPANKKENYILRCHITKENK